MIDLTPEEEARLRRWLAMKEPDIDQAVEAAAEKMLSPERIAAMGDQISAAVIPDIEALLVGLNERLTALEKQVMRMMPVVRRRQ
jgi:hypothetical protein